MTTRDDTWSTATRHIVHLCRHEVRDQRAYLAVWAALIVAHPLLASVPLPGAGAPRVALVFLVLPLLRVLLMTIVVGAIVHGDSPIDERAFWRTRPIAPVHLALAKWLVVVLTFVVLPTVVVCAVALSVQVPIWHWPWMLFQVIATEGAITGLVLVLASRTRHIAALLLATTGVAGVLVLLLNALEQLRRVPWMRDRGLMADSVLATGAGLSVMTVAAIGLLVLAYRGHAARRPFAVAILATFLALVAPWFLPALRTPRPAPFAVDVDMDGATVRAEQLGPTDDRVGLVVEPRVVNLRDTDRAQVFLLDGRLQTRHGPRESRRSNEPRSVVASAGRPQAPLVAVLDATTFAALAGRPVRFEGRFNVDVTREETVAAAPLEVGQTLTGDVTFLRLDDVRPQPAITSWDTVATGRQIYLQRPTVTRWGVEFRLRDRDGGCVTQGYPQVLLPFQADVVLPTLARPFSVYEVALALPPNGCTPDLGRTIVEMRRTQHPAPTAVPVAFSFVVPERVDPARVTRLPRTR